MIVFIPSHDDATNANHTVVSRILPILNTNCLLSVDAIKANLDQQISVKVYRNYFIMTHGNSDKFYDNNSFPAIETSDSTKFSNEKLFVFACYTANGLGRLISSNNNYYWGYTGPLSSLVDAPQSIVIFSGILSFIISSVFEANTEDEIRAFISNLKNLCDSGCTQIDQIKEDDENYNVFEAYNSLNHIWQRLRVYTPNSTNFIKHDDAFDGDIFEK